MKPKSNRKFILLASVPMIVGTLFFLNLKFNSTCNGLVEALGSVVTIIGLCLIGGITVVTQIVLMINRPEWKYRGTTISLVILSGISIIWSSNKPLDYLKSEVVLEAEFQSPWEGNLKLRKDGTYSAQEKHVEWSCTHEGNYTESGNLLILEPELVVQTDSIFHDIYILKETFLIPKNEYQVKTDSSHWLRIVKNKR